MCGTVYKNKATYYDGDEMIDDRDRLVAGTRWGKGHDGVRATATNLTLPATMRVNWKKLFDRQLSQWLIKIDAEMARWLSFCQRRSGEERHGGQCCCCKERG